MITVERETTSPIMQRVLSEVTTELGSGFTCGPFSVKLAEKIAFGLVSCPTCFSYRHAPASLRDAA